MSILILLGWLAPSVLALGIGLHLALDHHAPHGDEHQAKIVDLMKAVSHGHHHDHGTMPEHQHYAHFDGQAPVLRFHLSLLGALPTPPLWPATRVEESTLDRSPSSGLPPPRFTTNCSLLL